jgi:hypothetical protein
MKNLFALALIFLLGSFTAVAQEDGKTEIVDGPKMTFESTTVDYGTIEKDGDPIRYAKFTNTGTEPLIIKHAKGSCGCTVPTVPKEPIMPGESGEIKIRYATNRVGSINKTVRVTTNEGGQPHILRVKGKVLKEEAKESVPKNEDNMLNSQEG